MQTTHTLSPMYAEADHTGKRSKWGHKMMKYASRWAFLIQKHKARNQTLKLHLYWSLPSHHHQRFISMSLQNVIQHSTETNHALPAATGKPPGLGTSPSLPASLVRTAILWQKHSLQILARLNWEKPLKANCTQFALVPERTNKQKQSCVSSVAQRERCAHLQPLRRRHCGALSSASLSSPPAGPSLSLSPPPAASLLPGYLLARSVQHLSYIAANYHSSNDCIFVFFFFSCPSIPEFCSLERGQRGLPGPGRAEQVYGAVWGLVAPSRGRSANCSGTPLGGSSPEPSRAGVPLPEAAPERNVSENWVWVFQELFNSLTCPAKPLCETWSAKNVYIHVHDSKVCGIFSLPHWLFSLSRSIFIYF